VHRDFLITLYLLTAIVLTPGGSSTVRIYKQTIHRTTQNKQYTERHKTNSTQNDTKQTVHRTTQLRTQLGRVWAVPRVCELYPGTEVKAPKNLSQPS